MIPLPQAIDDEYLRDTGTGVQPVEIHSVLDAFIVSVSILEVMDGAQEIHYDSINHNFRLPELVEVLRLNEKLDEIERKLPAHLKQNESKEASTPRDRVFKLQAEAVLAR